MKKLFFLAIFCLFFFASSVFAGPLYLNYNPTTQILSVEGDKFVPWGCHDTEVVEWDRFVKIIKGDNNYKSPQINLIAYGVGEAELSVFQLPVSKAMLFYGSIANVPPGTNFQISALVWKNNLQDLEFWALDALHPIPAEVNMRGVKKVRVDDGDNDPKNDIWVFQTTSCQ